MNKKFIIVALAVVTFGAVGCRKDYECDCHIDTTDGEHIDMEYEASSLKKSEAEDWCHDIEHNLEEVPSYEDVHCDLK